MMEGMFDWGCEGRECTDVMLRDEEGVGGWEGMIVIGEYG